MRELSPRRPHRIAVLSVHTSPLEQPGTGDAGGMNVYVVQLARQLAQRDIEVEIFTRLTSGELPPAVELSPGVLVRHITAGPLEGLPKDDLPAQLCAFTSGVLRAEADHEPGYYDLVHSHYWLSGQVGWLAKERWGVPLVHTAHTLAKVKNALLADGDTPEPRARVIGEQQVVDAADRLVASTSDEAAQLVGLYGADPSAVVTVPPGVDLDAYRPALRGQRTARRGLDVADDAVVLLFVGRIQPLKGPDVLLRAAARMLADDPSLRTRLVVAVVGGPSGSGLAAPEHLQRLSHQLGLDGVVRFVQPLPPPQLAQWYRAATVTAVPSHNESFGLVAVESQACGTPVVAAAVGGLRTAVSDGRSGLLVDSHDPAAWAAALRRVALDRGERTRLAQGALVHAGQFGWAGTADGMLAAYADILAPSVRLAAVD